MPFKPSSSAEFQASQQDGIQPYRVNGTYLAATEDEQFRIDMYTAFQAYMARDDIESRASILAREDAEPGTIFWAAQPNQGEVTVIEDGAPIGP